MLNWLDSFLHVNSLVIFGLILILGVIGGQLAYRSRFFPKITGYILIGLLFGPNLLGVITQSSLSEVKILIDIAVGLVVFQLGSQINIRQLYSNRSILWMGVAESFLTFFMIFLALQLLKINTLTAALAAAIGVSSSPALTLALAGDKGNMGEVSQRSLTLTAINNILAFCLFMFLIPFLHASANPDSFKLFMLFDPFYRLMGSVLLGSGLGYLMIKVGRFIGSREEAQFALLVGILVLSIGLAKMLHISEILTPLILGVAVINMDKNNHLVEIELGHSGQLFFIILFVLTGAKLHLNQLAAVGLVAFVFVIVRTISKCLPVFVISKMVGFSNTQSYALGLTLLPMASMAIGLLNTATEISGEVASLLSTIILASVAMIELTSPVIATFAFKKVGEIEADGAFEH
jgi:Kef-type K+ transport system membrane component KefB